MTDDSDRTVRDDGAREEPDDRRASGLHVRCPHCQCPIELVPDAELESIRCDSCGSSFGLLSGAADATRAAQPSARVAHFLLVERLGMGAFGTVWKAHDEKLDRTVAVKIPRTRQLDRKQQEQFLHEARSAARLRHPHIVPVYEAGRDGDTLYIVSELVRGETLAQWLEGGAVTARETATLGAKIARALDHAHDQGVIHRDLKPANVMLDGAGEPHLMDFGLARREANEITMTLEGQVLGTPAYMSPEQAQGDSHKADRRSDVYSLGVMLYQMLTGELPFRGNARMMMQQVIHYEPMNPRKLYSAVPKDLDTLVMRCLEKSPARRFALARELAEELDRYLRGEPILSRPISQVERAWRWCQRKPVVAGMSAAIAALALMLAIGGPLAAVRQASLRRTAEQNEATAKEATRQAEESEATAQESERRTADAYTALKDESARILFNHGNAEYAAGRMSASCEEIFRAWAMCSENNPQKSAFLRVLVDRLTRGGRSTVALHHGDDVSAVAFSPDGERVLTGSWENVAQVWDAATGRPIGRPMQHEALADAMSQRPTGPIRQPSENTHLRHYIRALAFSADSRHVLTAAFYGPVQRWDAATGEPAGKPINHKYLSRAAFSPDGGRALTSAVQTAQLWNTVTGEPIGKPMGALGFVAAMEFSSDGRRVVTGCWVKMGRLWDAETGQAIGEPMRHDKSVFGAAFSPDGRRIVTASDDQTVRVWDGVSAEPAGEPIGLGRQITVVRFTGDSQRVVAATDDNLARLWDPATGKSLGEPMRHEGKIVAIASSPDGRFVVTGSADETARVWDAATGAPVGEPLRHDGRVYSVAFSRDSRRVMTGAWDRTARIWDVGAGQQPGESRGKPGPLGWAISCFDVSADGKLLVGGSDVGQVQRWDAATGQAVGGVMQHDGVVNDVAYSADGRYVVSASDDLTARIWDAETGAAVGQPLRHARAVTCIAMSSDGRRIVTGSDAAIVWDATTSQPLGKPLRLTGGVEAVAFSPDGRRVIAGSDDEGARIMDAATGEALGEPMLHDQPVRAVAFSPDGRRVLTGSWDQTARLWDAATGQPIGDPLRHDDRIDWVAFSPDGERALTESVDHVARMWDAVTGQPLGQPLRLEGGLPAIFTRDGNRLVTVSGKSEGELIDASRVPAPREAEAWLELLVGKRQDAAGQLAPLSAEEVAARWSLLEQDDDWIERLRAWNDRGRTNPSGIAD